ncbi:hypothetical protein GF337_02590, partial [candidate division KSB1 bacterium]|nr:hypothetical protein [candidate division KSB1 bacterium]
MKKILLITIFLLNCSYAQVSINAGLYNENIKQLFINDLDLIQQGTSPLIFWLRFDNSQPAAANVYLKLSFIYVDHFKGQVRELLRGQTQPIEIPSAGLSLTNQDIFSGNGSYKLRDYGIDRQAADNIMDYILSTGKIPSGRYEFMLRIFDSKTHSRLDETVIELEISDQISIDLISPGEKADISHLPEIYTKLPHFRWESNATRFRLRVCEKLPGNNSPEEV